MRALLLAGVAVCGLASTASASLVTGTYSFQTRFASGPYGNVAGSFDAVYDTSVSGQISVTNVVVNLPASYQPIKFFYRTDDSYLLFGNTCNVLGCSFLPNSDVVSSGFHVGTAGDVVPGPFDRLVYEVAIGNTQYTSASLIEQFTPALAAIPEPASLLLLTIGAVGIAVGRRRREQ